MIHFIRLLTILLRSTRWIVSTSIGNSYAVRVAPEVHTHNLLITPVSTLESLR